MSKSIIQDKKECYICNSTYNIEEHHIFFGTANRKVSEKFGLKVFLCTEHHRGTYGVHGKNGKLLDKQLKKMAQRKFEETYTRNEFIRNFGKNYL
jgi:hypothetical protein